MHARLSIGRAIGICLFVAGVLLFYFVLPIVYPLGMLATWLTVWPIFIIIATGCALMFGFGLKTYIKSMLAGVSALFLVTMISMTSLPLDLQLLLISLFGLIMVLLSRLYLRRKSRKHASVETVQITHISFPKKVLGCVLIMASVPLFYFVIPIALLHGLFVAWLATWPMFFIAFIGFSLILKISFIDAVKGLFNAIIVTLLPWIVILPSDLQILSGILLGLGLTISLLFCIVVEIDSRNYKRI
jgi:hypothetical protein